MELWVEYLKEPVGIASAAPRFTFRCDDRYEGVQKSFRIVVGKEKELVNGLVWDSGEVSGTASENIAYAGEALESLTKYYWQVTVTDEDGKASTACASFTTGLMDENEWKAAWVAPGGMSVGATRFRTEICLKAKPVKAYSLVASINYYMFYVNGKKVTDSVLNNADTDPRHTVPYLTTEVTDLLTEGKNVLSMDLGCGWPEMEYSLSHGALNEHGFAEQLFVEYEDGTSEWFCSDPNEWIYTVESPFVEDSIYHGEVYDARKDLPGWNTLETEPVCDSKTWSRALEYEPPTGKIRSLMLEPIRKIRKMVPVAVYKLEDGSYSFDYGQNFAGWVELHVKGESGQKIELSYAELEFADHQVNKMSIRYAKAIDTYICKGEGEEVYEPSFTFHGFRYVNIKGLTGEVTAENAVAWVVSSDVAQISDFTTSDALLNQLQKNVCWTEISNLHSLPTDCPQRDERLGWTNDMTVRNECALYNFRLPALYTKWMGDIRDSQGKTTGAISDTVPFRRFGSSAQDPVAAVPAVLPWNVYMHYGDEEILRDNYEMNKKWAGFMLRNSDAHIVRWSHMGDWAGPLEGTHASGDEGIGGGAVSVITPTILVATAHAMYVNEILARMAKVLGHEEDRIYYEAEAAAYKEAINKRYYDPETKNYASGSQGSNTVGLYFGLVPEADKAALVENLVADIRKHNNHLTTGNLCSRYIIEVLFQNGRADVAYDLLTQKTYPSWGYMVENGATTMWERYEQVIDWSSHLSEMASYNHPMNGAFAVSFYKYLAGINPSLEAPGFKKFTVRPFVPQALESVDASLDTMAGKIRVAWKQDAEGFKMEVDVPFGTEALVSVPAADASKVEISSSAECTGSADGYVNYKVGAGKYSFCAAK